MFQALILQLDGTQEFKGAPALLPHGLLTQISPDMGALRDPER